MAAQRDKAGRFLPGHNILSDGRPKIPDNIKEAFRALVPEAVEILGAIMRNPKEKTLGRLDAIKTILDRAYGKPAQSQDISFDVNNTADVLTQIRRVAMEQLNDGQRDSTAP